MVTGGIEPCIRDKGVPGHGIPGSKEINGVPECGKHGVPFFPVFLFIYLFFFLFLFLRRKLIFH